MWKKKRTLWSVLKDYSFQKAIYHIVFFPLRLDNGEFYSYYTTLLDGPRLYYKVYLHLEVQQTQLQMDVQPSIHGYILIS